jgi:hypothetical protein
VHDMTAQDAFDALVRDHIAPPLSVLGFKRTRATFHRPVEENWEVINLQRSQFSSAASVSFTANLAVGLDILREGVHDWAEGKRPPESRCHFRSRIGWLLSRQDVWWDIKPDTDLLAMSEAVLEAVTRYGLPWLAVYSHPEQAWPAHRDDLRSLHFMELKPLGQLVAKLGLPDAEEAVAAERQRRNEEVRRLREPRG